ncbi:hypothetical protein [Paludisphaera mucosa]|uniref:Uncharacterized protein n=1 Tax=Paludisphaera mucosa TaxID=3030827 RepID=A0ABT6FGD6_9BACT|nr:hypothetical protein [Paludisphaera mucosa]MDG3006620.1 hypothetical protein [Paludisphaera mucosa]
MSKSNDIEVKVLKGGVLADRKAGGRGRLPRGATLRVPPTVAAFLSEWGVCERLDGAQGPDVRSPGSNRRIETRPAR